MIVRPEARIDIADIRTLVAKAFEGVPHSAGTEGAIIDALRKDAALTVSLVAEHEAEIVGHVAFSPVEIEGKTLDWYGLGPIAVAPERQRLGIGSALVEAGLERIRRLGAAGCVVLGDPAYYSRFGFKTDPDLLFPGVPAEYFQRLDFGKVELKGVVVYHPAFYSA